MSIQFMLIVEMMPCDAFQKNAKLQMSCVIQLHNESKNNSRNNNLSMKRSVRDVVMYISREYDSVSLLSSSSNYCTLKL